MTTASFNFKAQTGGRSEPVPTEEITLNYEAITWDYSKENNAEETKVLTNVGPDTGIHGEPDEEDPLQTRPNPAEDLDAMGLNVEDPTDDNPTAADHNHKKWIDIQSFSTDIHRPAGDSFEFTSFEATEADPDVFEIAIIAQSDGAAPDRAGEVSETPQPDDEDGPPFFDTNGDAFIF